MAYKIYQKQLSSYERKRLDRRRQQRQLKRERKTTETDAEWLTRENLAAMTLAVLDSTVEEFKARIERTQPDALSLISGDFLATVTNFANAGRKDLIKEMLAQMPEDDLFALCGLLLANAAVPASKTQAEETFPC